MIFAMKRTFILALSFNLILSATAFADNRPTIESNEAAIKADRSRISAKTAEFETDLKNKNMPAAQTTAVNLLDQMQHGMELTRIKLNLQTGDPQKQQVTNGHYLKMEKLTHDFQIASTNVPANGQQMLGYAQRYLKEY